MQEIRCGNLCESSRIGVDIYYFVISPIVPIQMDIQGVTTQGKQLHVVLRVEGPNAISFLAMT